MIETGAKKPETASEPSRSSPGVTNPQSKTGNPKSGKRPYVRKEPFKDTPARRAARMENLKKAQAVPKEKRYRPSEKRKAANRKSLEKARATLRERKGAGMGDSG